MRQLSIGEAVEFPLTSKASIRVYADCRPHALQTTKLQKGGVLVLNGRELLEEGVGLGFPVCLYEDGAHFSLSAVTFVDDSKDIPLIKTGLLKPKMPPFRHLTHHHVTLGWSPTSIFRLAPPFWKLAKLYRFGTFNDISAQKIYFLTIITLV